MHTIVSILFFRFNKCLHEKKNSFIMINKESPPHKKICIYTHIYIVYIICIRICVFQYIYINAENLNLELSEPLKFARDIPNIETSEKKGVRFYDSLKWKTEMWLKITQA